MDSSNHSLDNFCSCLFLLFQKNKIKNHKSFFLISVLLVFTLRVASFQMQVAKTILGSPPVRRNAQKPNKQKTLDGTRQDEIP